MATKFDWGKFAQDNKYAKKWSGISDISELTDTPVSMAKGSILNENKSLNEYMYSIREKAKAEAEEKKLLAAEDVSYRKISNYNPRAEITKWNTGNSNTSPLTGMEKFSNQFLGVFGGIKNLKKSKKAYVIKSSGINDPVSNKIKEVVFENPMEIDVIAEDKNNYYARDETGNVTAFEKKNTVDRAPDPEEQNKMYKASIVRNKKQTANMMDKLQYNVSQGVQSVAFGTEDQGFVPTGNKVLDVASKYGGQIAGFGTPTGAGGAAFEGANSLFGVASKVVGKGLGTVGGKAFGGAAKITEKGILGAGERLIDKGVTKVASKLGTKAASKLIAPGITKAALTGAADMAAYSAAQENPSVKKTATNVAMGVAGGVAIHGLAKVGSKVLERFATKAEGAGESKLGEVITKYRADQKAVDKLEVDLKSKYTKIPMTEKAKLQADKKAVAKLEAQLKGMTGKEDIAASIADKKAIAKLETELNSKFGTKTPKIEDEKVLKEKLDREVQDQIKELKSTIGKGTESNKVSNTELEQTAMDRLTNGYENATGKIGKSDTITKLEKLGWDFKKPVAEELSIPKLNAGIKTGETKVPTAPTKIEAKAGSKIENLMTDYKVKSGEKVPKVTTGEQVPVKTDLQMFGAKKRNAPKTAISEYIVSGRTKEPLGTRIKKGWEGFYTQMVDKNHPLLNLEKVVKKVTGKRDLLAAESPHKLASIVGNYEGIAQTTIDRYIPDKLGKKVANSKSYKEIAKAIPKGKEDELNEYMVAKHAITWMEPAKKVKSAKSLAEFDAKVKKGKLNAKAQAALAKKMGLNDMEAKKVFPKNITTDMLKDIVTHYENKYPEFEAIQRDFTKYSRQIMKTFLVDSGLISKKSYLDIVKNYPFYVPFQRLMEDAEKLAGGGVGGKFVNTGQQIKAAVGSERKILTPLESIIKNTFNYVKAMKNAEVGQAMLKQVLKHPNEFKGQFEIIEKYNDKSLEKALKSGDFDTLIDDISNTFDPATINKINKSGTNDVVIRLNGKAFKVRVSDPEYLKALTNLNGRSTNAFIEVPRVVTNKMKVLTTGANLMFSLMRNIWRDIPLSYILDPYKDLKPIYGQVKYFGEILGSTVEVFAKSAGFKEFNAIGGGFVSSVKSATGLMEKTMSKYVEKSITPGKIVKGTFKPIDLLMDFSNALETSPRYNVYKKTVKALTKKGISEAAAKQEGLYNSAEVTVNFRRHGDAAKAADAFLPYFNAAIQGIDRFARVKNDSPKEIIRKTIAGIEMLTIPGMFLYFLNKPNKEYQKLSQYVKDNNFCIPIGTNTFLKIPKPREFGAIFNLLPERFMDVLETRDPKAFAGLTDALAYAFLPPDIYDTIISPITRNRSEAGENWRGTALIPQRLLDLPANMQYTDKTSRVSIQASKALDFMGIKYSPMKIDDILGSYLGVISQVGIPATSGEVKNEKDLLNKMIDVLKRQATADSRYSTDEPDEFYTNMKKVTNDKAVAKLNNKLGAKETYMDRASYIFGQAAKSIAELRDQQRKAKTNEEKDSIQEKMIKIYTKTNKDYDEYYTKKEGMKSIKRDRNFIRPGTKKKEYKWWEE